FGSDARSSGNENGRKHPCECDRCGPVDQNSAPGGSCHDLYYPLVRMENPSVLSDSSVGQHEVRYADRSAAARDRILGLIAQESRRSIVYTTRTTSGRLDQ